MKKRFRWNWFWLFFKHTNRFRSRCTLPVILSGRHCWVVGLEFDLELVGLQFAFTVNLTGYSIGTGYELVSIGLVEFTFRPTMQRRCSRQSPDWAESKVLWKSRVSTIAVFRNRSRSSFDRSLFTQFGLQHSMASVLSGSRSVARSDLEFYEFLVCVRRQMHTGEMHSGDPEDNPNGAQLTGSTIWSSGVRVKFAHCKHTRNGLRNGLRLRILSAD